MSILSGSILAVLLAYFIADPHSDSERHVSGPEGGPPTLSIAAFEIDGAFDAELAALAEGMRRQLAGDLASFRNLRVLLQPNQSDSNSTPQMPGSRYELRGTLETGAAPGLALALDDHTTDETIWRGRMAMPDSDAEFYERLTLAERAVVARLGGTTGLIQEQELERLDARSAQRGEEASTSYACMLRFGAFDASKSPEDEQRARSCLARQVVEGTRDSSVWAAWAFMLFLDWTKLPAAGSSDLMQSALSAAEYAVDLDPQNALAHEYLGSILLAQGRMDAAQEAYERALALNPAKADLYVVLGWSMILRDDDWRGGLESIQRGIQLAPDEAGWMRIPLSIDAFRSGAYDLARLQADRILETGDERGAILALTAAISDDDDVAARRYFQLFVESGGYLDDPMREIRKVFNHPETMARYEAVLDDDVLDALRR